MNIRNLLKADKRKISIIALGLVGVGLLLFSALYSSDIDCTAEEYTSVGFYTEYLEERITNLCNSINGVSNARVFLTLDTSSEYVYQNDGASDFLILTGDKGETAVKLCEIYPRVRGIAVVCTGGDLPRIKETVTELLSAALGVPTNKIKVAGYG